MSADATGNPLGLRFLALAAAGTVISALVLGIPTAIIPNSIFHRVFAASPANYFFWISTSVVTGALLATYLLPCAIRDRTAEAGLGGGSSPTSRSVAHSATKPWWLCSAPRGR